MTCVFLFSHAPAILTLSVPGYENRQDEILFFLVVLTQLSDVFQFVCGKAFGRHRVAPSVSPNKTIEGLLGGMLLTGLTAVFLSELTPLPVLEDFILGIAVCLFGFCGGLTMSAVKRDKGCKDFGTLLRGHGGILDRIDSLCFTAPLLFHFTRYFYTL
jgi:phosphatidate cytidylyltransferase